MSQNTQESGSAPSRTIYINPFFKKAKAQVINGAVNIVNSKLISSGAHINPLFLSANRPAIHMNPNFLKRKLLPPSQLQHNHDDRKANGTNAVSSHFQTAKIVQTTNSQQNLLNQPNQFEKLSVNTNHNEPLVRKETTQKIISKSRTKIVREPAAMCKVTNIAPSAPSATSAPLIRLSSRKLIRRSHISPTLTTRTLSHGITRAKSVNTVGKYKIDRRLKIPLITTNKIHLAPGVKMKRKTFVARYALQRSNSEPKTIPRSSERRSISVNKKIQMLNINGVLYKSTRNKLQRKDTNIHPSQSGSARMPLLNNKTNSDKSVAHKRKTTTYGRVLFVHGTKFVLDKSGFKLTRVSSEYQNMTKGSQNQIETPQRQRQRIDIGGLTYIASATQNVFVRTRNHLALAHLNMAKNRSLQLLTRRLVKSNIPCAIFQRIGKCKAHERGKCNKVHDKQQITICPRFLRSECHNTACLLSHNVSLAKMPVCRFYLQGVCVRVDCPYLHKKLSVNVDICPNFLRGYCELAERCNKRHEFVCPEYNRSGKCELLNCKYCKSRKRKIFNEKPKIQQSKDMMKIVRKESSVQEIQERNAPSLRYFIEKENNSTSIAQIQDIKIDENSDPEVEACDSDSDMTSVQLRPKVGTLPAFIPLS